MAMAAKKPAKKSTGSRGLTAEERAAMKDRIKELKGGGEGVEAVLARIASMPEPDRTMGQRVHSIITSTAPQLSPRLWYGMPAYSKDGNVLCWFQDAKKFKSRYATLGFSDKANLDDGPVWPVAFALKDLTASGETQIRKLVKRAVS